MLAHFHSYPVVLAVACWIGFNKGLRTVFMALAIPSHVPLDRLPGATGIHLLFAGIFYLLAGPLVGKSVKGTVAVRLAFVAGVRFISIN